METVQLQCGNCQNVMAIAAEHQGEQVQCPHCRSVVQTPPRKMELDERVSIGAGAMPISVSPTNIAAGAPPATDDADADLTSFKRPALHGTGIGPLMLMVFLIPYAILMTLFVLYLLFGQPRPPHPLDVLPDPAPGKDKGGPRPTQLRIIHNHELAAHQKTSLGKSLRIGDLVVEPKRVFLNEYDELLLVLKTRNVSADTTFEPIHELFVRYAPREDGVGKPYTFLESKSREVENIYGGIPSYRNAKGETTAIHRLHPGEEASVGLLTTSMYKTHVKKIAAGADSYLWRVQLRRGFVQHNGKNVPATAVIGVEFTSDQIERSAKK